jgi:CHAT domain-containing protein
MSLAKAQGADDSAVYLQERATETQVRSMDLSSYRILAFATHGLVAGDLEGVAEPALVLTPPDEGSEADDGLLTASEIATLDLDADWVILSACNTAAADGKPGAEGLSGLAKAFFYAGARALLVSHWSVNSEAAVAITTGMLGQMAEEPDIGRAEALRRSMLAMLETEGKDHFAHPMFWAPFVVVGEGGTPM